MVDGGNTGSSPEPSTITPWKKLALLVIAVVAIFLALTITLVVKVDRLHETPPLPQQTDSATISQQADSATIPQQPDSPTSFPSLQPTCAPSPARNTSYVNEAAAVLQDQCVNFQCAVQDHEEALDFVSALVVKIDPVDPDTVETGNPDTDPSLEDVVAVGKQASTAFTEFTKILSTFKTNGKKYTEVSETFNKVSRVAAFAGTFFAAAGLVFAIKDLFDPPPSLTSQINSMIEDQTKVLLSAMEENTDEVLDSINQLGDELKQFILSREVVNELYAAVGTLEDGMNLDGDNSAKCDYYRICEEPGTNPNRVTSRLDAAFFKSDFGNFFESLRRGIQDEADALSAWMAFLGNLLSHLERLLAQTHFCRIAKSMIIDQSIACEAAAVSLGTVNNHLAGNLANIRYPG